MNRSHCGHFHHGTPATLDNAVTGTYRSAQRALHALVYILAAKGSHKRFKSAFTTVGNGQRNNLHTGHRGT